MDVFIIHGTGGSPDENWFPWLKAELEKSGCRVFVPRFPTPENQSLQSWLEVFEKYEKYLEDSILVGHSIGSAFLLDVLENNGPVKASFLVAGFTGLLNNKFDRFNKSFSDRKFNWPRIRSNCKSFYVISSDDDPYVPLDKGRYLAESLDAEFTVISNAGHFNAERGFTEFDFLLEKINGELD